MNMKTFSNRVYEFAERPIEELMDINNKKSLSEDELETLLLNASKKFKENGKRPKFYTIEGHNLKFRNYVGFLRIENYQFEILPKIWETDGNDQDINETIENFTKFFIYGALENYTFDRNFESGIRHKYTSFLDMLVYHYFISLERELREGPYSEYVEIGEKGKFLKGRLDLNKQINSIDKSSFHVKYYNHSYDNHLNRNLLFATEYMADNSLISNNETRLSNLISLFPEDISEIQEWNFREFYFNRLNERFQVPYNYAYLIVNRNVFSHNNGRKYYSFLYDMNELFEKFIANLIERNYSTIFGLGFERKNIKKQITERSLLYKEGKPFFIPRPDIFINDTVNKRRIIIDTKYQIMEDREDDDEDELNFEECKKAKSSHLYQLYTYSKLYEANIAIIIYPLENSDQEETKRNENKDTRASSICTYTFEREGTTKFKMCGIPMDLSGEKKSWENRLINNLKKCLSD